MKVTIDGKTIQVKGRKTVLEAAREQGIYIPSLCDHPDLEPFGGCRLCLVEIEGRRGYPPACSTYLEDGMSVQTDTPKIKELRRGALELILSEHPNACLICREKENCDEYKSTIRKVADVTGCVLCPNNGRCELQDVTAAMGLERIHFSSVYRNVDMHRKDPFFDRDYNLCILCGRCVRICREVRGASVLTFIERGAETIVGTVLDQPLLDSGCQFCGACVDVCPTGAHTDRAIRYEELPDKKEPAVCPLCSMGCRLEIRTKEGRFIQSLPDKNGPANHGQACVRGRFLMPALTRTEERIQSPMIRKKEGWEAVSWDEALKLAAEQLGSFEEGRTVLMSSPQLSCEDLFVLNRFSQDILKTAPVSPALGLSPLAAVRGLEDKPGASPLQPSKLDDISAKDTFLLTGTDLTVSHPMVWLRVWESIQNGGHLVVISPDELPFAAKALWLQPKPGTEPLVMMSIAAAAGAKQNHLPEVENKQEYAALLNKVRKMDVETLTGVSPDQINAAAGILAEGRKSLYFVGPENTARSDSRLLLSALWNLAVQNKAGLFPLELESNQKGWAAVHSGAASGDFDQGMDALKKGKGTALIAAGPVSLPDNISPEFTVALAAYPNKLTEKADIILPLSVFGEEDAIFVNIEGRVQKSGAVLEPEGDARPAWRAASDLAQKMGRSDFDYAKGQEVRKAMQTKLAAWSGYDEKKAEAGGFFLEESPPEAPPSFLPVEPSGLEPEASGMRLSVQWTTDHYLGLLFSEIIPGFRLVRDWRWIEMNPEEAGKKKIQSAEEIVLASPNGQVEGVVRLNKRIPKGMVKIIRPGFLSYEYEPMNLCEVTIKRKK